MKTYQYQILRYLPDKVNGEFINLGVVVYDASDAKLTGLFYKKTTRLHSFFPDANAKFVVKTIKFLESAIERIAADLKKPISFEQYDSLNEITAQVLPKDDSALFFTAVNKALDVDITTFSKDLYSRIVLRNIQDEDSDTMLDKEVWKKVYKSYFDKYELTKELHPAKIKTHLDEWNFERTCQNGALHCFESVSFELSNADYIKKKVYTWAGRVEELKTAKQEIHLYLLSVLPEERKLISFIKEKLGHLQLGKATVELVSVNNADKVIKTVQKQLHEQHPDIKLLEDANLKTIPKTRHLTNSTKQMKRNKPS
ncbi:MAG: DUF3037 domain-containing protein [Bacteroidota bacterium]